MFKNTLGQKSSDSQKAETKEHKEYKDEVEQQKTFGKMHYNVDINLNIPNMEQEVQEFWKREKIFERSVENRSTSNQYVLFDGPPFATGLPHYGHMLAGALKDVFPRYHSMKGKRVERRFGWDCHGVPIEFEIEKMYKTEGIDFRTQSIADFNERCRSIVLRYTNEWRKTVERLGRFVDMDNDYKTMDPAYMESVWSVFKTLQTKGLVYEGKRVLAYSTGLRTVLSDFESKLNYKTVQDPEITIAFQLLSDPTVSLLVWTTTPWTVPTNVAIAINKNVEYVKVTSKKDKKAYILAKAAVEKYFAPEHIQAQENIPVDNIINQTYAPMFNTAERGTACYKVYHGSFVSSDNGTGLVHISPAFGEDDYNLGKEHNLPALDFFDKDGCFNAQVPVVVDEKSQHDLFKGLAGVQFKTANTALIQYMRDNGRVFKKGVISHEYPLCWRTDTPLMYRAVPSWYVQVTAIKDKIIENNKKISWYPEEVGTKRFHSWLENARDWSVSRNRFWGCPLPIWRNEADPTDCLFIGSIKELEALSGQKVTDIHSHKIDHLLINQNGKTYRRVPEVFDCWFESGAMPYAQIHYPFENQATFLKQYFPADFIAEGLDQTRGWFYTLLVLSTALFDKPAFKNCVVNGIILGTDGKKMSKLKGNYPNINEMFDKHGADAIRYFLLGSGATKAQEIVMSENEILVAVKKILIPIMNVYKFFGITANKNNFRYDPHFNFHALHDDINKSFIYRVELFKSKVTTNFDEYNLTAACAEIQDFVTYVSQWYVRSIKHYIVDEQYNWHEETLHCLHYALDVFSKCAAPILPFISDFIFRNLYGMNRSVHLENWPTSMNVELYQDYFARIEKTQRVVHLGNRIRDEQNIRLRQALPKVYLNAELREELSIYEDLIKKELNVEKIIWIDSTIASTMVVKKFSLKPKVLGQKYKSEFKEIKEAFESGDYSFKDDVFHIRDKEIQKDEMDVQLTYKEGIYGAQEEDLVVILDTTIDLSLEEDTILRDIMHEVQMIRKKNHLSAMDSIEVNISGSLCEIIAKYEGKFKAFLDKTSSVLVSALDLVVDNKECSFGKYAGNIAINHLKKIDDVTIKEIKETLYALGHSKSEVDDMQFSKVVSLFMLSKAPDSSSTLPAISMQGQLESLQRQLQPEVPQPLAPSPSAVTFTASGSSQVKIHTAAASQKNLEPAVKKPAAGKEEKASSNPKEPKQLRKKKVTGVQ